MDVDWKKCWQPTPITIKCKYCGFKWTTQKPEYLHSIEQVKYNEYLIRHYFACTMCVIYKESN
jgi:hypothetical protein